MHHLENHIVQPTHYPSSRYFDIALANHPDIQVHLKIDSTSNTVLDCRWSSRGPRGLIPGINQLTDVCVGLTVDELLALSFETLTQHISGPWHPPINSVFQAIQRQLSANLQ